MQSSRPLHLYRSKNGRPSIFGAVNLVLLLYQTLSYVWIILLILQKPFEVANKSLVWNLLKIESLVNSWHFKLTFWTSFRSIICLKISTTYWNELTDYTWCLSIEISIIVCNRAYMYGSKLVFYKQMACKLSGLKSRNIFTAYTLFIILFALLNILTSHPSYSHKTETSIVHENSISWGELLVKISSFMKKWTKTTLIRCKNPRLIPQLIFGAQRK